MILLLWPSGTSRKKEAKRSGRYAKKATELAVIASSMQVLEKNPVRAMDALHLACAQVWQADVFVSADVRQLAAAKKTGLRIHSVG